MTSTTYSGSRRGAGWISYAAVMLLLAGSFNVIDGIVGLSKSSFYVNGARFVFSDLRTWAWIVLICGTLEVVAGLTVANGSSFARWFGIGIAGLNAIAQLLYLPGYPLWSIAAFTMNVLIIYALVVYGGQNVTSTA